jgi:hypothetical protein
MNRIISLLVLLLTLSCEHDKPKQDNSDAKGIDIETTRNKEQHGFLLDSSAYFVDSVVRSFVELSIQTLPNENYTYEIYQASLNPDQITDAIISVNRCAYAKEKAESSGYLSQAENVGFMGPFNLFIFYDGASNTFTMPVPVPSSPLLPLSISFENISSNRHKDLVVDFRIRNSSYKEIYFLFNNKPSKVFQWKNFDGLGTKESEAYSFEFNPGNGRVRDIVVYNAQIKAPKAEIDPFVYKPEILNSTELMKNFFYVPAQGKYFSTKNGLEE